MFVVNEESKALEQSNNEVDDEFTQSRFRGVAYRLEILDNSSTRVPVRVSLSNFSFASFLSTDDLLCCGHCQSVLHPVPADHDG